MDEAEGEREAGREGEKQVPDFHPSLHLSSDASAFTRCTNTDSRSVCVCVCSCVIQLLILVSLSEEKGRKNNRSVVIFFFFLSELQID